jgi:hypothetical protein
MRISKRISVAPAMPNRGGRERALDALREVPSVLLGHDLGRLRVTECSAVRVKVGEFQATTGAAVDGDRYLKDGGCVCPRPCGCDRDVGWRFDAHFAAAFVGFADVDEHGIAVAMCSGVPNQAQHRFRRHRW